MRLKLSAIMAIAVMAIACDGFSLLGFFLLTVLTMAAFVADTTSAGSAPKNNSVRSRYVKTELMTGMGWGSQREELRAHLLGVWEPRLQPPVIECLEVAKKTTLTKIKQLELVGYSGLFAASIASFFLLPISVLGLSIAAFAQYRLTTRWNLLSPLLFNAMITISILVFFLGYKMLVLTPVILIFARKGASND